MKYVQFELVNGKRRQLKRKLAEHLEVRGKGNIVRSEPVREVLASDSVREEAEKLGVYLSAVQGSGKNGRILKSDLAAYRTRMLVAE